MTQQSGSLKQRVITELYNLCKSRKDFVFDNDEVREVSRRIGFGNAFDATKWDNSSLLPEELRNEDAFVIHLGTLRGQRRIGRHQFVFGIATGYHNFESIPEERKYQWPYRRSILNNINTSESNILAVGYNQRIIHDFLYEDITASPKVYGSNRTRIPLDFHIGNDAINIDSVQIEIDMTLENMGIITVFEAKNGEPQDFNVFQLFNPFRYYLQNTEQVPGSFINCCYLLRIENRLRLYLYSFNNQRDPGSIQFIRNAEYTLVER